MKIKYLHIVAILFLSIFLTNHIFAQNGKVFEKTFSAKSKIKIKLVLGDCSITKSPDNDIHVKVTYTYDEDKFEIQVKDKSKTLHLQEKIYGDNAKGDSDWNLLIPDDAEIDFSTATGDLTIKNVSMEIDGNSGTGDIEVNNANGEFELNTGTGRIDVRDAQGEFDLNSGTGRVVLTNCTGEFDANSGTNDVSGVNLSIDGQGDFNSGTGDVDIKDPGGKDFELSLNSGTGDATLELDEIPLEGYFEFKTNTGRIKSPVDFDKETEEEYDRDRSIRKSFTKVKKLPRYFISSGTGTAQLKN